MTADSATAHRRLAELLAEMPAGPIGDLLRHALTASTTALARVRGAAAAGEALSPSRSLDVPHDREARRLYDDCGTLVRIQRNVTYRAQLLTVPTAAGEQRFLISGLNRAVGELEQLVTRPAADPRTR